MMFLTRRVVAFLVLAAAAAFVGQKSETPPSTTAAAEVPPTEAASPFDSLPQDVRDAMDKPMTGDLDAMMQPHSVRVAVKFNRTHYFIDKGQQRGLTFESLKLFEDELNAQSKTGNLKVHVVFLPMPRNIFRHPHARF